MYYSRLGMHDQEVNWFLKGLQSRDVDVQYVVGLPGPQELFKDLRLKHIPEEIGLPGY